MLFLDFNERKALRRRSLYHSTSCTLRAVPDSHPGVSLGARAGRLATHRGGRQRGCLRSSEPGSSASPCRGGPPSTGTSHIVVVGPRGCRVACFELQLGACSPPSHPRAACPPQPAKKPKTDVPANGDRRKGVPWTEEEHRLFLLGLAKFGKGDWRSIARNFVVSRTPTQVGPRSGQGSERICRQRQWAPRSVLQVILRQVATERCA